MLLQDKNAVVYGAGGFIGGAVARAFAREGARVFLTGRGQDKLEAVAKDIAASGGLAEVAVVDALEQEAVDEHAAGVVERAGSLDISFNLATRGDVQGIPLAQMTNEDLLRPVTNGLNATFNTARAAARHMTQQGSGVILALNSGSANGSPMMGGTGLADAATDALIRNLAMELGPSGIRAVGIWTAGLPETFTRERLGEVNADLLTNDEAYNALLQNLSDMRWLRRSPTLAEVADTAVFLASAAAGSITGAWVNVTGGMFA